jgi:hypothetical protein
MVTGETLAGLVGARVTLAECVPVNPPAVLAVNVRLLPPGTVVSEVPLAGETVSQGLGLLESIE